jgi:hypothetical protein
LVATSAAKASERASGSGRPWRSAITNRAATSARTSAPCRRLQATKGGGEQRLGRITRRSTHRVGLLAFGFEHNRVDRIDDHLKKRDVKGPERAATRTAEVSAQGRRSAHERRECRPWPCDQRRRPCPPRSRRLGHSHGSDRSRPHPDSRGPLEGRVGGGELRRCCAAPA